MACFENYKNLGIPKSLNRIKEWNGTNYTSKIWSFLILLPPNCRIQSHWFILLGPQSHFILSQKCYSFSWTSPSPQTAFKLEAGRAFLTQKSFSKMHPSHRSVHLVQSFVFWPFRRLIIYFRLFNAVESKCSI